MNWIMNIRRTGLLALAGVFLFVGQAKATAQGGSNASQNDAQIESDVMKSLENKRFKDVKASVKNGVVTLTGDVTSQDDRTRARHVSSTVFNVQQVVNELRLKGQKATSSN